MVTVMILSHPRMATPKYLTTSTVPQCPCNHGPWVQCPTSYTTGVTLNGHLTTGATPQCGRKETQLEAMETHNGHQMVSKEPCEAQPQPQNVPNAISVLLEGSDVQSPA
jgi:hypothetical protein